MSLKLKKIKKNIFYKIISVLLIVSSIVFLGLLYYMDLLPAKYSILLLSIVLIFDVINILLINLKRLKKKIKKAISVFIIFVSIAMVVVSFYLWRTTSVLLNNSDTKYKLENYSVLVLKESNYKKVKDLEGKTIGYFENSIGTNEALSKLEKKVDVKYKSYKNSDNMIHDLLDLELEAIIIEDSIKAILEEELPEFKDSVKTIYSLSIKTDVETILKEVDVTKETFAVYISGIDTYGEIASVSRSDVNMVMIVNPKIRQMLLISIPRDYYVQLNGTKGAKDKLTHAGIYGIDMSIKTIEDLLELDINYYIKVNFTSVIDIVNAIGGLDVYSEYSFISYSGYRFKKGLNSVNGKQALDFARTRKAFSDGDRQRGKNQQAVIEAIVRKVTDKSIITKYNSLLNAVNGKYQTNMSMKKVTSLIKMQLDDMSPWTVTSYSLTGKDSKDYTYTYNQLLYVMKPDQESIDEAINLINSVLNDKKLETSYNNINGTTNKVIQVQTNENQQPEEPNIDEDKEEKEDIDIKEDIEVDENEEKDNSNNTDDSLENQQPNENESDSSDASDSSDSTIEDETNKEDVDLEPIEPLVPTP